MSANITARVILLDDTCNLPDGTYEGLWSAYTISVHPGTPFAHEDDLVDLQTAAACKALGGMPVKVTVRNGRALVEY